LSEAGKTVRTTTIDEVARCSKLVTTTVNTLHKVGFLNRDDYKLRTELNDLARNEATKLGGNTLVAMTKPAQGSQTFAVYRCP
jgi:D-serine dehydratase